MKLRTYGMLALSLGLALTVVGPAFAVADKVETTRTRVERSTNAGQNGYWVEYTTKTYRYTEDAQKAAIRDAFIAVNGREPNAAEFSQWYNSLKNASAASIAAWDDQIINAYQSLMGRKPTSAELQSALQRMASGTSYSTIYNELYANSVPARVAASFPTISVSAGEAALIARLGDARISSLKAPAGIPGEASYPAGLFGRDPSTWRNLFDGGWSWTDRNALVNNALAGRAVPIRPWNASDLLTFVDWTSEGWWRNNSMTNLVQSLGAVYQDINNGGRPKIAVTFQQWPGSSVTRGLLWGGDGNTSYIVDQEYPGGLDRTVAYFMSEGQRYMEMSRSFSSVGAYSAAAQAKRNAESLLAMLAGVVSDPLVLDLNANGKIDVTGNSSAKIRNEENKEMVKQASVMFDLYKTGNAIRTEWIKDGDGLLVDDTKGEVTKLAKAGKPLTGAHLFGDVDGYTGGFFKLMAMDQETKHASLETKLTKGFGTLKGQELNGLKVWVDNGDGIATPNELKTLAEVGITEISLRPQMVKTNNGEILEQSYFIRNGQKQLIQEVWFAHE